MKAREARFHAMGLNGLVSAAPGKWGRFGLFGDCGEFPPAGRSGKHRAVLMRGITLHYQPLFIFSQQARLGTRNFGLPSGS